MSEQPSASARIEADRYTIEGGFPWTFERTFRVHDAAGALVLRDVLDGEDRVAGQIVRANRGLFGLLGPSRAFDLELGGVLVARFFRRGRGLRARYEVQVSRADPGIDPRFAIACTLAMHVGRYR